VIVTLGSSLGLVGMPGHIAYCSSKDVIVILTKALAAELAPLVRVNCLCPGGIETPMTDDDLAHYPDPALARQRALARTPLGRFATADEIARAALWLASDDAAFATGSVVTIDGGATMV